MKLEINDVLCKAEAISLQMMKCKVLQSLVHDLLSLSMYYNLILQEQESFYSVEP